MAVGVISLIYLAVAAATTYQKYVANNTDDQTAKVVIFVSGGLQILIALFGLFSAITKSVLITRVFASLWWSLTLAVLGLSIASLYFVTKDDKVAIENECQKDMTPVNGTAVITDTDVNSCYRTAVIVSAVVLAVQFLIMCLIGWVIQRFLREVKQDAAVAAALKSVDDEEV
ncbi:hypothetical protein BGZ58_002019 [Dissophora ornata]|nr:hypothetical protein BGZ58_002019 [Dissophora ornata]